jgi:very-short-patch-repair endonuclease
VVRAADEGADSPLESALRALLLEAGITGFRTQVLVPVGFNGIHVDLGDPVRRIALEADGFAYHGATRVDFERGVKRHDEITRVGWTLLRFTWGQVRYRPRWVVAVIEDVLADQDRPKRAASPA